MDTLCDKCPWVTDERSILLPQNYLIWEIYQKWITLCSVNSGSMGNPFDWQALQFLFDNYGLTQKEKEICIEKLEIIISQINEMNKEAKARTEEINKKFEARENIGNKPLSKRAKSKL